MFKGVSNLSLRETVSRVLSPSLLSPPQKNRRVIMGYRPGPCPWTPTNMVLSQSCPGFRHAVELTGELPRSQDTRKWPAYLGSVVTDRKLVQVEDKRVVVQSVGRLWEHDRAGRINEVTEAVLWPPFYWLLPRSGGRKVWDPTWVSCFH